MKLWIWREEMGEGGGCYVSNEEPVYDQWGLLSGTKTSVTYGFCQPAGAKIVAKIAGWRWPSPGAKPVQVEVTKAATSKVMKPKKAKR